MKAGLTLSFSLQTTVQLLSWPLRHILCQCSVISYADDAQLDDIPFLQLKKFDVITICAELICMLGWMHSQKTLLLGAT